jgi:Uma2 family endonuclease
MVTVIGNQKYTLEEYFELERSSEERYEFWDGSIWAMAGATSGHEIIVSNSIFHLRTILGRGCTVLGSNMKVFVPDFQPYRYPDLTVFCGKAEIEKIGGMEALLNPQMIIEILSPTTEAFDRGAKFSYYKSIPSFTDYLLVAVDRPNIIQYRKSDTDWIIREADGIEAKLQLPTFNVEISLSEIYLDVDFPEPKSNLFLVD